MLEVNYSKKQLNPLIQKYSIDVVNNEVFHKIILMFNEQPNYQVWAIKCVFGGVCPIEVISQIKDWAEKNQNEIKNLTKGNIVLYKSPSDIHNLLREMEGLDMIANTRNVINHFNTSQREMLKKVVFDNIKNGLDAKSSGRFNKYAKLFSNIELLPKHRKEHLINTSSAITDTNFLLEHINSALSASYDWEKEDMLSFMARNASDCSVVFDQGDVVILNVPSFESSKALCGNSRTGWCLTRERSYFNRYVVEPKDAKQYFLFDFSKREDDDLAHIGFTVRQNGGITNAHSTNNTSMLGTGISYKGKNINIYDALKDCKVPNKVFMSLRKLTNFKWDMESFLKFVNRNSETIAICFSENNRIVVHPLTQVALNCLFDHTLINKSDYNVTNDRKMYLVFDFNLEVNDDNSLVIMEYCKDKYGIESLNRMVNVYNSNIKNTDYLNSVGIHTSSFLNRENINPKVLLHKLIDEMNEDEAVALIANEGDDFDVNYEFSMSIPIFKAIEMKQFKVFKSIINHKMFNSETCDEFGESILMSLMFSYICDSSSTDDRKNIKKMIDIILDSKTFDFNVQDINLDTALHTACLKRDLNWVVDRLISKEEVNVNIINDWNCSPLGTAICSKNIDAIKLLCKRNDLNVRDEDFELANEYGVDLKGILSSVSKEKEKSHVAETFNNEVNSLEKLFMEALSKRK